MAIDYKKVGWDTTKYVNPTNMNQMDDGIKAACDGVDALNVEMEEVKVNASNKILKTYTSLQHVGYDDVSKVTTLTGLVPNGSQLVTSVSASMQEPLYNNGIIPVKAVGTLILTNTGRGFGMFITFNGIVYTCASNNASGEAWTKWKRVVNSDDLGNVTAITDQLVGYDYSTVYDDISSMVVGVHNSLSNYQSVCKNFAYSSNSALVIGNRFNDGRGRYLVMPRTSVESYIYQVKGDGVYNTRTIATTHDLANHVEDRLSFKWSDSGELQLSVDGGEPMNLAFENDLANYLPLNGIAQLATSFGGEGDGNSISMRTCVGTVVGGLFMQADYDSKVMYFGASGKGTGYFSAFKAKCDANGNIIADYYAPLQSLVNSNSRISAIEETLPDMTEATKEINEKLAGGRLTFAWTGSALAAYVDNTFVGNVSLSK